MSSLILPPFALTGSGSAGVDKLLRTNLKVFISVTFGFRSVNPCKCKIHLYKTEVIKFQGNGYWNYLTVNLDFLVLKLARLNRCLIHSWKAYDMLVVVTLNLFYWAVILCGIPCLCKASANTQSSVELWKCMGLEFVLFQIYATCSKFKKNK